MDTNIETYKRFNNEIELWLKMVDSLAHVITASTCLLRSIHNSEIPATSLENKLNNIYPTHPIIDIYSQSELFPSSEHPFDNISDKFRKFPEGRSIDYLDQQYRKAKQAIFKRYGPSNKITTLYTRNKANIDFIDDKINKNLYKISEKSSERRLEPFSADKVAEEYKINKSNSLKEWFETSEQSKM